MPKVLAIDDELPILQLVAEFLGDQDFEVATAANGKLALECLSTYQPDLIICDVAMPELNGHQLLLEIRKKPLLANVPFIFLTGMSERRHLREGMDLGADDYLTKPFSFQELLNAVQSRLAKSRQINQLVTEKLEEKEQFVKQMTLFDETTGLANRSALEKHFWELSQNGQELALLCFQLDGFEQSPAHFNAALGRAVMKALANRLVPFFEPNQKSLYYLGLNQFALVLQARQTENLLKTFEFIRLHLSPPFQILKQQLHFGMSAGIALYPRDAANLEGLVSKATQACQKARNLGGNQCLFVL